MDTSSEYIKMCQEAEEIQGIQTRILPLTKGNWFAMKSDYQTIIVRDGAMIVTPPAICFIWLPRQDQLQEMMVSEETEPVFIIIDKLAYFAMWVKYQCHEAYTSMEQLWLAFVMKENFGKVWDGENWVSEKTA